MSTEERTIRNDIEDSRAQNILSADALQIDMRKDLLTRIPHLQALKVQKSANIALLKQKIQMLESAQTELDVNLGRADIGLPLEQKSISEEQMRIEARAAENKRLLEEKEQNERANKERKNDILKELELLNAKREEAKREAEEEERKQKKEEDDRKKQEEDRLKAAAAQEKIRNACIFRRGR